MEVIGSEIGAQVRPVSEHGTVFHEAVSKKDLLATQDIGAGENEAAGRIDGPKRNRGLTGICPVGEQSENEKSKHQDDDDRLHPSLGDEQSACFPRWSHSSRQRLVESYHPRQS